MAPLPMELLLLVITVVVSSPLPCPVVVTGGTWENEWSKHPQGGTTPNEHW